MQRAKHSRFFRLIYCNPKQRDILSSIKICINSIYFTICINTFKNLVSSFPNVFTRITSLACISWINNNQRHAIKQTFVSQKRTKLREIPFTEFCTKLFVSSFGSKANVRQILNGNSFALFFCRLYNRFCNSVILNYCRSFFSPTKPFQEFFTPLRAFGLNGTTNPLFGFSIIIKPFARMFNTITCYSNIGQPKIHTDKFLNIHNICIRNVNGLKKVKLAFLVNQISFSFYVRQVVSIMANKRYFNPPTNSPKRNNVIRLISHNPTVITNASKWSKLPFSFLVKFVRISNLCYTSYQYLTTKFKCGFIRMVDFVMQFKIIENLLFPSYVRHRITNSISFPHRIENQVSLFISRQKFYFQCKFHSIINTYKYTKSFLYQKIILNLITLKALRVAYLPSTLRDEWVSRSV